MEIEQSEQNKQKSNIVSNFKLYLMCPNVVVIYRLNFKKTKRKDANNARPKILDLDTSNYGIDYTSKIHKSNNNNRYHAQSRQNISPILEHDHIIRFTRRIPHHLDLVKLFSTVNERTQYWINFDIEIKNVS